MSHHSPRKMTRRRAGENRPPPWMLPLRHEPHAAMSHKSLAPQKEGVPFLLSLQLSTTTIPPCDLPPFPTTLVWVFCGTSQQLGVTFLMPQSNFFCLACCYPILVKIEGVCWPGMRASPNSTFLFCSQTPTSSQLWVKISL